MCDYALVQLGCEARLKLRVKANQGRAPAPPADKSSCVIFSVGDAETGAVEERISQHRTKARRTFLSKGRALLFSSSRSWGFEGYCAMIPAELQSNHNGEMKSRTSYMGPRLLAASRDISISRGATVCEETSVCRHLLRLFAAFASTAVLPVISPQDVVVNSEGPRATVA